MKECTFLSTAVETPVRTGLDHKYLHRGDGNTLKYCSYHWIETSVHYEGTFLEYSHVSLEWGHNYQKVHTLLAKVVVICQ